jgi:hypothetical protein
MAIFDGATLARGWLSAAIASGSDGGIPVLDRTVLIEEHLDGVRLIATDKYVLLRAWVPNLDDRGASEPGLDELPDEVAVAIDPHGRGKGFFGHVLKLAREAEKAAQDEPTVGMTLGVVEQFGDEDRPVFAGMETRYVDLTLPGTERLRLPIFEGVYPDWRALLTGFEAIETKRVALTPDMAGRLGKLGKIHGGEAPLFFAWGGEQKAARVHVGLSWPAVDGLVMPCRWDLERNAPEPAATVDSDPDEDDQ